MDEILKGVGGAVEKIVAAGGVAGACLILTIAACVLLFRRLSQSEERLREATAGFAKALKEMYEIRIVESQKASSVLEQNSRALIALEASMESRTAAFGEVTSGFQILSAALRSFMETNREQMNRLGRDLDDVRRVR